MSGLRIFDRRSLLLLLSLLLSAGFFATTLFGYFVSRQAIRDAIAGQDLPLTASNIYSEIQKDLVRPLVDRVLMEKSGSFHYLVNGDNYILNVNDLPELKWYRFVEQNEETALAGLLVGDLRESDLAVRWGGEEFLIVLVGCNLDESRRIAEKLREKIATSPIGVDNQSFAVTVSIGISQYDGSEIPDETVSRADTALYAAKNGGRNRVEVAEKKELA